MLVANHQKLKGFHLFLSKWVAINLWIIKQLRTFNLSLVRYIDQELLKDKSKVPKRSTSITANIHITLFHDNSLSYKTSGEPCDLTATLATVMLERPEFNEMYQNAQKVIAYYQAENN